MGPYETEEEARAESPQQGDDRLSHLLGVCAAAGVELGAFDLSIVEWLTTFEPTTCQVIAGLIARSHGAAFRRD